VLRSSSCATLGAMWTDHINSNTSETSAYDRSSIKSGLVSNLKHHLKSAREDNSTSNIPFNDPVMRKSLSHLELDDNQQYGGAQSDAKLELEALRSSGTTSSIFKLERGRANSNLRKAQSNIEVAQSQDNIDLDDETIEEVRQNKQQIKAMFEAAAPKYRYGGSNECLIKDEEKSKKGPVMRPAVKAKEERKWVLDTINQYFDVIVEEEDEEEESDMVEDSSDEEMSEVSDEDFEYEEEDLPDYQSTSRIRSLLTKAASNVSQSQTNLANLSLLKQKLGSRISLGLKQSMENLSSL